MITVCEPLGFQMVRFVLFLFTKEVRFLAIVTVFFDSS